MPFFIDWQLVIAAVRFWLVGGDPYGPFPRLNGEMTFVGAFAYPPPVLLLGVPLALLPPVLSGLLVMGLAVVGFEVWARQSGGRRSALIWLPLWLPLAQGLWIGQLTLISLVGLALAELAARQRKDRLAGMLLALAILKPQTVLLPVAWLLVVALRERRWALLASFAALSAALWLAPLLVAGPQIYTQWLVGLDGYDQFLPNRPLLFPPFGPLLGGLALLLWRRHGRSDIFGLALLANTLIYPLSVIYVATAIALVVIRWQPRWAWYPLILSWLIPIVFPLAVRTPDTIAGLTQAIIATGLLAGLLPPLPWPRRGSPVLQ
ncbi:MAG: DUF2029 domain-containing protein [Oscillochloris sp.]|nr:DUF2029 domain-containing protein [Oscillochloris sp.]